MNTFVSTMRVSVALFALFAAFTIFHSPNANALIQVGGGCTYDAETGTLTCPGGGGGGGGGGSCRDDDSCYGGGGGGGNTGCGSACGGGGSDAVSTEQAKSIVQRYKLECKPANQSPEVYSASQIESCKTASYSAALREYPVLRALPGGTASLRGMIAPLCIAHVADQIASGNDKACP